MPWQQNSAKAKATTLRPKLARKTGYKVNFRPFFVKFCLFSQSPSTILIDIADALSRISATLSYLVPLFENESKEFDFHKNEL